MVTDSDGSSQDLVNATRMEVHVKVELIKISGGLVSFLGIGPSI